MSTEIKILQPEDLDSILMLERSLLPEGEESQFVEWSAVWRKESLEHYLPQGWSFGAWASGELMGYTLAQPLLFFQGLTQNLWVEHIRANEEKLMAELVEVSYRWSRDKHLQRVLFSRGNEYYFALEAWNPDKLTEGIYTVKTAKY